MPGKPRIEKIDEKEMEKVNRGGRGKKKWIKAYVEKKTAEAIEGIPSRLGDYPVEIIEIGEPLALLEPTNLSIKEQLDFWEDEKVKEMLKEELGVGGREQIKKGERKITLLTRVLLVLLVLSLAILTLLQFR